MQPLTLVQAAGLARLQEEKLFDGRRPPRPRSSFFSSPTPPAPPVAVALSSVPLASPSIPSRLAVLIKRLSPEELTLWRERGFCFNCDEKFHRGHKCASKAFLLIGDDEEPFEDAAPSLEPSPYPPDPTDPLQAQISLHTLSGHLAPETLRLVGQVALLPVMILVDRGSTHNFIQESVVKQLGLSPCQTAPLWVMVGNGHTLDCHLLCEATMITILDITFCVDLHVLPLCGANLVLGVQWLKSLGPVLTDYNKLSMKFMREGRLVKFQGDTDASLHLITPHQLR